MTIVPFLKTVDHVIINPLIYLMFSLALVYFTYNVVKYLSLDAADAKRAEARSAIMWSIVGMVVMVSVYGIIKFVLATFGITDIAADVKPFIGQ